jgi:hypothetical protein
MICSKCKKDLDENKFAWRNKAKQKRQSSCKECHAKYIKKHYKEHKTEYIYRAKRDKDKEAKKNEDQLNVLKSCGCKICKDMRLPVLEFHHLDPNEKEDSISKMTSRKKIENESKKCVVLCKNCHAIEHYLLRLGKSQLTGV